MGSPSGGLCPGVSLSRGVSVQGGLCLGGVGPGGLCPGGLCVGRVSVQGGLCPGGVCVRETPGQRPPPLVCTSCWSG